MNLLTTVSFPKYEKKIDTHHNIFSIGSCFSENIGNKLSEHKFQILNNPFGTLFNPISISKVLDESLSTNEIAINHIHQNQDVYFHFDYHSQFNSLDPQEVISKINTRNTETNAYLKQVDWIIITLGTSIVYRHIQSDTIVANCHKIPQREFKREFLTIDSMKSALKNSISKIKAINPVVKFILTVSPIRHLKEGLIDNNRSKSKLIELCHQLSSNDIIYFPSYEIIMDELRDYRYYTDDMLHPTPLAINYIWQKFQSSLFTLEAQQKVKDVSKINNMLNHRPFNPESDGHLKFLAKLDSEKQRIQSIYPEVKF